MNVCGRDSGEDWQAANGADPQAGAHQLLDPSPDHFQLLARAQTVDRSGAHPGGDLVLQRSHSDLVELVEQLREDGQELGPFQKRDAVVLGKVKQARPEIEARLFPVGEPLITEGLHLLQGGRRT